MFTTELVGRMEYLLNLILLELSFFSVCFLVLLEKIHYKIYVIGWLFDTKKLQ